MKHRRIVAGLLAISVITSNVFIEGVEVSASNSGVVSEELLTESKVQMYSGMNIGANQIDTLSEIVNSGNEVDESVDDASKITESTTENPDTPEQNPDSTDSNTESGQDNAGAADTNADEQVQTMSADLTLDKLSFYDAALKTATVSDPVQLILLSYCDLSNATDIKIDITTTGEFDLTQVVKKGTDLSKYIKSNGTSATGQTVTASQDYSYQGLGNENVPFSGTIEGQTPAIKANTTIFGGLSSSARVEQQALSIGWSGDGTVPMLAGTYVLTDADEHEIPISFTSGTGSLIGTVKTNSTGTLKISNKVSYAKTVTVGSEKSTDNAGLICNTLESGNIVLDGYSFPTKTTINSGNGAAGAMIGKIESGTLTITSVSNGIEGLEVTSASGYAGSTVGEMTDQASVVVNADVAVASPTVSGKYAGGFAGKVTKGNFSGEGKITISAPTISSGTNTDSNVGGYVGDYIATEAGGATQQLPDQIVISGTPKVTTNGGFAVNGGYVGGYFGMLELQGKFTYQIAGTSDKHVQVATDFTSGNGGSYGAIAGKITSSQKEASVIIKNVDIDSTNGKQSYYQGGMIGELGENVYLQVGNVQITVSDAYAKDNACGFGGIAGHLSANSVLQVTDNVKVIVSSGTVTSGGGLVGYADSGSILELSGETDLSGVNYSASQYVGQLVGGQNCALLYARGDGNGNGWKYIRSKFASGSSYINDIGNYGEILRLKAGDAEKGLASDLFKINETSHDIEYGKTITSTGGVTITSIEDFALLSVAWNSHGVFSTVSDVTKDTWSNLKSVSINFLGDVDLTGTGIIGISRDSDALSEGDYTGKISGDGHKVTLSIGETYGYKGNSQTADGTDGCGKIYPTNFKINNVDYYYHKYLGLFASSQETIENLTISGKIDVSGANGEVSIGSIAARKVGNTSKYLSSVTVDTSISLNAIGDYKYSYVGGVYGETTGDDIELRSDVKAKAIIKISNCKDTNDDRTYVGGILGYVPGAVKIKCNGVTVGGSITTDAPRYAYVGGVVGFMAPQGDTKEPYRWIEIRNLVFNGFAINASKANIACGGLLGSVWSCTGVYFMGDDDSHDTIDGKDATKMTVKDATINAPNASVGGLSYRASGIWEIRTDGIDMQNMTIHCGKDLGLLVCHGEKSDVPRGWTVTDGVLYLRTTKDWTKAYKINEKLNLQCGNNAIFDELVAYTASSKESISNNGENGVVSLATTDTTNRDGVSESESNCTTYQNRTTYGKKHPTNECSRYYYDLDQYVKDAYAAAATRSDGKIDTPEELLLWSCYRYAGDNIKKYFCGYDVGSNRYNVDDIKNNVTVISGNLDMKKYSYYPIRLNSGITISDATITFYNDQIESAETTAKNKSTKKIPSGTSSVQTQHYMMHCGLFLDHTSVDASTTISLNNVTFAGSIGKVDSSSSGVLFSGTLSGTEKDGKQYKENIKLTNITLAGLKVTDYANNEYAPLLINQIGSYTKTEVKGLKTTDAYKAGTAVASSLFGNAGSADGHQVNMSFSDIVLPDKPVSINDKTGIFTHATLLESYKYADNDTSVATYNFYKKGDWTDNNTYNHQVTYGKEISASSEYAGLQKWYYDKDTYNKDKGKVITGDNVDDFSTWLPYVYVSYDETNHAHEIRVNQRVYDIVNGCGTYGHPYVITDPEELEIISEYMITDMPRVDWKITIVKNQSTYCTGKNDNDITFRYDGEKWIEIQKNGTSDEEWGDKEGGETRTNDFMLRYMLNAYYDLQGQASGTSTSLTLENFKGLGTAENPFRGVLTSTNNANIILKGSDTGNGLITYSYGSVVRNLNINYQGEQKTLTYKQASSIMYPGNCFGGVIGCILGGDNIIDGVKVTFTDKWLNLSGANKHLLQVGGYVGSVCGGGILFRNMKDAKGLSDNMISGGSVGYQAYNSLYVNPYVGRVMDGYAFADATGNTPDNTDKNYQIQNLSVSGTYTKSLTVTSEGVEIKDARGLLLLSAIVNSGAASSGTSNAYRKVTENINNYTFGNGEFGKVRNASYENIGSETQPDDFTKAVNDDTKSPGETNTPYLITTYATSNLFNMAVASGSTTGATLSFPKNGQLDMSGYGSSYQGISARYVSNAVTSGSGNNAAGVVPMITAINGNGTQITLNTVVREYADDDFHAASVGGVFNLFNAKYGGGNTGSASVSNLTLKGKTTDNGVALQYYDASGNVAANASNWKYQSNVGVGSLFGSSSGAGASSSWYTASIKFSNIVFEDMKVKGPSVAGGLMGNLGRLASGGNTAAGNIAILLQPYPGGNGQQTLYISSTFENCSYSGLTVEGQSTAGGFCGWIDGQATPQTNLNVTDASVVVGSSSTISATLSDSQVGGLYGYVRRNVGVNKNGTQPVILKDVNVSAGRYAGGLIGQANVDANIYAYNINNVQVLSTDGKTQIKGTSTGEIYAGGIAGYVTSYSNRNQIVNCKIENVTINEDNNNITSAGSANKRAGGIVGLVNAGAVKVDNCKVTSTNIYGSLSGGIAGSVNTTATISNCELSGSTATVKGGKCAAGIIGVIVNSNKVGIHDSQVNNVSIVSLGDWASGGLVGDISWGSVPYLYLFDSVINGCSITGTRAGGLTGDVRGNLNGSNLLLKDTTIKATNTNQTGLLTGQTGNKDLKPMSIAGISIQNTTASENGKNITKLYGTENNTQLREVEKQSYFSFADYDGIASETKKDLLEASEKSPFVVTSPVSSLKIRNGSDATAEDKYLYGDSAAWEKTDSGYTVNAQKIFNEAKGSATSGKYTYTEMGVDTFDFGTNISTYNTNQPGSTISEDFPVLVLADNATETITNYLDILTNGGYTRANSIEDTSANSPHVDASVTTYKYDNGVFKPLSITATSDEKNSLEVKKDAKGRISEFATTTEYDNTRNRFTLLTVTFTEKDESNAEHKYNIQIPIIVRRMLEIDFTATLSSGTNFKASNFDAIKDDAHLLESVGNPFTAYLTYTYNSDKGSYSDYGWQSYINAGGNVAVSLDRKISFRGTALPVGTQLSLIDCQNGSKVYYYTVIDTTDSTKIALTDFKDSSGNSYQPESIGELMNVTMTPDNNGNFIKVDATGKPEGATEDGNYNLPTVRMKNGNTYEYYRLKQAGETGTLYTATVNEDSLVNKITNESTVSQNYYLVVTVAALQTVDNLNGSVQTDVSGAIPHQIHYRTRNGKVEDNHSSTASTYQISKGYQQELSENASGAVKKLTISDSTMLVDVVDKITIPSGQAFQSQDELYQKFSGSLLKTIAKDTSVSTSAELFPNGTTGNAEFYVYVMNGTEKQYYIYKDGHWKSTGSTPTKALDYNWTATDGLMDLPLSTDGTIDNAVSLQEIRKAVLNAKGTEFYVEVKMNAKLSASGLNVVPETSTGNTGEPADYIKLAYTSQLSTAKKSLSYSTARALLQETHTKYYRDEPIGAQLTYEADEISQLGINLLDLQHLDVDQNNAIIDTTAMYDMSAIKDLANTLSTSKGIRFKIQLQNKKTDQTEQYNEVLSIGSYIHVDVRSENSGKAEVTDNGTSYSWTVPKATYWDSQANELKTGSIFNGDALTQAIRLKVNVKNVNELYSNYRVVLTAEIIQSDNQAVDHTNASDNIIYTFTKIKPEFVDSTTGN